MDQFRQSPARVMVIGPFADDALVERLFRLPPQHHE
jgi:hypothetical protein